MNKEQIISLAESMGFDLEYDRFYEKLHPADAYPYPAHMIFVHKNDPGEKKSPSGCGTRKKLTRKT